MNRSAAAPPENCLELRDDCLGGASILVDPARVQKAISPPISQASSARILTLDGWRKPAFHIAIFVFAVAVVIARRPDAVFHAQFYAEDGRVWFADAYNIGSFSAMLHPQDGYFQTLPRLGAALALLVPFSLAPLVMNLVAIIIQAIPVNLMLSSRSAPWGSFRFRAGLAALYIFLPNTREMASTITESQWILALIAFLLLMALPPKRALFDVVALMLCSLTGPFCLFLLPVAVTLLCIGRGRSRWINTGALSIGLFIQGLSLLFHSSARPHPFLGANLEWLSRILSGAIYLGTLLGGNGLGPHLSSWALFGITVTGTAVMLLGVRFSAEAMRCLLFLSCVMLVASLINPAAFPATGNTAWKLLATCAGARYWFFPSLAFAWSLAYLARSSTQWVRCVGCFLLFSMSVGLLRDARYPAFKNLTDEYTERMMAAPAGSVVVVPLNPSGWDMRLIKHDRPE
jgi:hypothetical protein